MQSQLFNLNRMTHIPTLKNECKLLLTKCINDMYVMNHKLLSSAITCIVLNCSRQLSPLYNSFRRLAMALQP